MKTPFGNFVGHTKMHARAKNGAKITNYVVTDRKTVPFLGLKIVLFCTKKMETHFFMWKLQKLYIEKLFV